MEGIHRKIVAATFAIMAASVMLTFVLTYITSDSLIYHVIFYTIIGSMVALLAETCGLVMFIGVGSVLFPDMFEGISE